MRGNRKGFTLVELLVVIGVIAILVSIAMPSFKAVRIKAREAEVTKNLDTIRKALEQFAVDYNGFYPYRVRVFDDNSGEELINTDLNYFYPLGIWGGVEVAFPDGSLNSMVLDKPYNEPQWSDDYSTYFNQYTDPLRALGYLNSYPGNPFMERPMGAILWSFHRDDVTIPSPGVVVCAGDFVYTYNMGDPVDDPGGAVSTNREDPPSVVTEAISYRLPNLTAIGGVEYRVDLVDNYQLWAYGRLDLNGTYWVAYPNNSLAPPTRPREPKRDFNGNGIRDEFERGLVSYFSGGRKFYEDKTSTGDKIEF